MTAAITRPAGVEERVLAWLTSRALGRLGHLAARRGDRHMARHVTLAVMAGNTEEPAHTPCVVDQVPYEQIADRYRNPADHERTDR